MNDCENSLKEALRMLTEAGPRAAPERVEIALQAAFRRHHRARELRRIVIGAIVAGAAAAGIVFMVHVPGPVGGPSVIAVHPAPPVIEFAAPEKKTSTQSKASAVTVRPVHKPTHRPRMDQLATTEFVRLPYGDDALVDESTTIVRVEMPRSALRLAGFAVAQERANDRIQADVVLGADGLAHAVRFVQ